MKIKGKIKAVVSIILTMAIVYCGLSCVSARLPDMRKTGSDMVLMSAALTMSRGGKSKVQETTLPETQPVTEKLTEAVTKPLKSDFSESYYNSFSNHKGAKKYPVYTRFYTGTGKRYDNFYVKNSTAYSLDIGKELKSPTGFKMENSPKVQVLIYHTHTCESYLDSDTGYYYSDYYPRTSDRRYNVTQVGDAIAKELERNGIGVVHDTTVHDKSYNGSYGRSRVTVENYIKKYPDIKVTLDIHRDSIGSDNYKVKPTFTCNGKKGAQIMIMSGYDAYEGFNFPNWKYNLRFALKLQQKCESNYKGMTRPLYFGNFAYNMNINTGSLLIEVGTDSNTLDEAVYSGKLLGRALTEVLQNKG